MVAFHICRCCCLPLSIVPPRVLLRDMSFAVAFDCIFWEFLEKLVWITFCLEKCLLLSPKHRKVGIAGVLDKSGNTISNENAGKELMSYWGKVFQEHDIDHTKAVRFLRENSKVFPHTTWTISYGDFLDIINSTHHSAPGMDGIPYAAWKSTANITSRFLYDAYLCWLRRGVLPDDFNFAYLWILSKGEENVPKFPKETRPLSGSNADAKLLTLALKTVFDSILDDWAFMGQRGFISERVMIENIIEVEAKAISTMSLNKSGAMICYNFAAAFPSVSRAFMWLVLEIIGIPQFIIKAIQALYANNHHYFRWDGTLLYAFLSAAGVRQGCPLSSALFVVITDPILRAIFRSIPPHCMVREYADDLAVILNDFWRQAPAVAEVFNEVALISCLVLNGRKRVIVPLWRYQEKSLRSLLIELVPLWRNFIIDTKAKYLGDYIGPGGCDAGWNGAMSKYLQRC